MIDLCNEKLPVEARQRDGEQVVVTRLAASAEVTGSFDHDTLRQVPAEFEVMFDKGLRTVRADGTHHERSDLDIVEIIRPALPFGLRAEDGWLLHNGGECPVAAGTVVDLCFRKASPVRNPPYLRYLEMHDQQANPKDQWDHRQDEHDIVAYRVIEEAPQPTPADHIADAGKMVLPPGLNTEDGWRPWPGGRGAPHDGLVDVAYRWEFEPGGPGPVLDVASTPSADLEWAHDPAEPEYDIVAWRPAAAEPEAEPKGPNPKLEAMMERKRHVDAVREERIYLGRLRDQFAAAALMSFSSEGNPTIEAVSVHAYRLADAMIAARKAGAG